jgi:hypothetical protein
LEIKETQELLDLLVLLGHKALLVMLVEWVLLVPLDRADFKVYRV